jgi:hypothetical protein
MRTLGTGRETVVASMGEFGRRMNKLADKVAQGGPALQRKTALAILRNVILGTPVGNKQIWLEPGKARVGYVGGRARANWFVGVGSANGDTTETEDPAGQATISAGQSTIESHTKGDIHLTNNLPYIIPLNNGHSHQAPAGFIEQAVDAGVNLVHSARITEGDAGSEP